MTAQKIMLLGEIGVGKSSIAQRLVFNRFETDYKPTLGVDVYTYEIETPTDADPRRPQNSSSGTRTATSASRSCPTSTSRRRPPLLSSATSARRTTLMRMLELGNSFMEAMPGRYCSFLINKSDLENAATELPQDLIKSPIPMLRTSAKTGENVKNAFLRAADAIRRRGL